MQHQTTSLQTPDGTKIFAQNWLPEQGSRASILIVHGWAEHSSRYGHFAESLVDRQYHVFAYDHRGHGRSEGARADIDTFETYLTDLDLVYRDVKAKVNAGPIFVFGHSMGGLITCLYAIRHNPDWQGIILSGAALKINEDLSPLLIRLSSFLRFIAPGMKTMKLDVNLLTRDTSVIQKVLRDPLHYKDGVRARQGHTFLEASRTMFDRMEDFSLPVLILHGGADRLVDPQASIQLDARATSTDKTLKIYQGAFHELVNEINREEVISDILSWLDARTTSV